MVGKFTPIECPDRVSHSIHGTRIRHIIGFPCINAHRCLSTLHALRSYSVDPRKAVFRRSSVDPRKAVFRRSSVDPRKGVFRRSLVGSSERNPFYASMFLTLFQESLSEKTKVMYMQCNRVDTYTFLVQ